MAKSGMEIVRDEERIRVNLEAYLDALSWYGACRSQVEYAKLGVEYYKALLIEAGGQAEIERYPDG